MSDKDIKVKGVILKKSSVVKLRVGGCRERIRYSELQRNIYEKPFTEETPEKECGILNLDESGGTKTHWICWFKSAKYKISFDSYGLPPPEELTKYLQSPVYYNS